MSNRFGSRSYERHYWNSIMLVILFMVSGLLGLYLALTGWHMISIVLSVFNVGLASYIILRR